MKGQIYEVKFLCIQTNQLVWNSVMIIIKGSTNDYSSNDSELNFLKVSGDIYRNHK